MARDLKPKKRKEPSEATRSSKKLKQAPATESTESAKTAKTLEPTLSDDINPAAVKAKASRKRAADYLNEDQIGSSNEGTLNGVSKSTGNAKVAKKAKLGGKVEASHKRETAEEPEEEGEGSAVLEEEELDDHTAALLKGFESSEDEEEVEDDEAVIEEIPPIPNDQSLKKSLKNAAGDTDEAGVLYVGHIPHGFYEQQMRSYFSQFGDVTRLRLSRNPKTGKPRHYAFVEFASSEVATIVAKTMDKYLMFGHILQVRTIPKEQVHENLFQGANRRFKPIPRAKLEARKLRAPKSKEEWNKKVELEEAKRKAKLDKLKEIGYEFEAPVIKVSGSLTADSKTIEASADSPQRLLTETPHGEEEQKEVAPSKTKASGARKAKAKPVEEEVPTEGRATRASRTSTRIAQAQKTGRTKAR